MKIHPGNHCTRRQQMKSSKGPIKPLDPKGEIRFNQLQDRLLRESTNGLCGFDASGEITMAVDPANVTELN